MFTILNIAVASSILFSGGEEIHNKGMTWTKKDIHDLAGVVTVGCGYTAGAGNQCNPYQGDTPCTALLPVLCFYPGDLPKPSHVHNRTIRYQWSGGIVGTTAPISGNSFETIAQVNQFCAESFGQGWRAAEFHDGWGWNFLAYGNVGANYEHNQRRFWVDINDQPNGNCWSR